MLYTWNSVFILFDIIYIYTFLDSLYFLLSLAVSSNHKNSNKKLLKCLHLHVMNLEYMKVSLFEMLKKITFS